MSEKQIDVVSFGGCYLDINSPGLPFTDAGIPTEEEIRGNSYECLPGGSGINFARALLRLGKNCHFIGMRGPDSIGTVVEDMCQVEGLDIELAVAPGTRTNVGMNMISDRGDHIVFSVGSANQALNAEVLLPRLKQILQKNHFLYMGTLYKLDGLADDFKEIIALARNVGAKVIVDHGRITPGAPIERYDRVREAVLEADYYLPSKNEFLQTWQVASISDGLQKIQSQAPGLKVVVKDGAQGAHYMENDEVRTLAAPVVPLAQNVTGAGDTFNAGLLAGLMSGKSLRDGIEMACEVAARHVGTANNLE